VKNLSKANPSATILNDSTIVDSAIQSGVLLQKERKILALPEEPTATGKTAQVTMRLLGQSHLPLVAKEVILEITQHSSPSDWLHFIIDDQFREHRMHQIRVALIAQWLIDNNIILLPDDKNGTAIAALSWATCICHDHGYALARLAKAVPDLVQRGLCGTEEEREMRFDHLCDFFGGLFSKSLIKWILEPINNTDIMKCIQQQLGNSDRIPIERATLKRIVDEIPFNHGVWSAVNISWLFSEKGLPWKFVEKDQISSLAVNNLLEAVAAHHLDELPSGNVVLGILVLADELQEWGRITRGQAEEMVEISCKVQVEKVKPKEVCLGFTYSKEHLKKVKWSVDEFRQDKQNNIKRLRSITGMPKLSVEVHAH